MVSVPLEHLESGKRICDTKGKVAFGSMNWELFRQLDQKRGGLKVNTYIYASLSGEPTKLAVTWQGLYIGHVDNLGENIRNFALRPP
jgi:hypothetical protein